MTNDVGHNRISTVPFIMHTPPAHLSVARRWRVEMASFICRGTVELRGVDFFIEAATLEEAIAKAEAGQFEDYETACAETFNWTMNSRTVEPNE